MAILKGSYGWWDGKGYRVITKRRKKLVDGKTHRVVELKLVYEPIKDNEYYLWTADMSRPSNILWVPIGNFSRYFKIDNTIGLLFEKEINAKET